MKTNIYMEYEDLFWNLIITLRGNGVPINKVSCNLVDEYFKILLKHLNNQNLDIRYTLNEDSKTSFLNTKSKYYKYDQKNNSIILLENRKADDIIIKHQVCLPSYILKSIYDDNVVLEVLEAYVYLLANSTKEEIKDIKKKIKNKKK